MKYMWSNQSVEDSVNMQTGNNDFTIRSEYNLKMIENIQNANPKKAKRFRSAFTTDQVNYLEKQFRKFPYIGNSGRKEVAMALNISERAVKIWFQNRRMKEKKEKIDNEPSNRKSQEFVKDQLNNVTTSSANDQQLYSLPLINDDNKVVSDKNVTSSPSSNFTTGLLVKDSGSETYEGRRIPVRSIDASAYIKPRNLSSLTNYTKSAEFSIDMCKKYKNESIIKPNLTLPISDMDQQDKKLPVEHKPMNYKLLEQMVPEDLSSSRKVTVPSASQIQIPNMAANNPGYISVVPTMSPFYTQPYYNSGGVLWKPVNVVPSATGPGLSIPVSVASSLGSMGTVQENVSKCCSCDCHLKAQIPYNLQQQSASPQYIITAVQFPNPSAAKF